MREVSSGRIALIPQSFPPPWTLLSGFDASSVSECGVGAIGVKLYTMHWPMMLRAHGDAIAASNPAVASHPRLGEALMRVADVDSDATRSARLFRSAIRSQTTRTPPAPPNRQGRFAALLWPRARSRSGRLRMATARLAISPDARKSHLKPLTEDCLSIAMAICQMTSSTRLVASRARMRGGDHEDHEYPHAGYM